MPYQKSLIFADPYYSSTQKFQKISTFASDQHKYANQNILQETILVKLALVLTYLLKQCQVNWPLFHIPFQIVFFA